MKIFRYFSVLLVLTALGCATSPSEQITQAPANDIALAEVTPSIDKFLLSTVRWGGRIVKTTELKVKAPVLKGNTDSTVGSGDQTMLQVEILEFPLNDQAEPLTSESSSGRFIALIKPPYKKSAFYRNRHITVTGNITSKDERPLPSGGVQQFPVVTTHDTYTWIRNDDDHYRFWPRLFYGFGVSKGHAGFGVIFH